MNYAKLKNIGIDCASLEEYDILIKNLIKDGFLDKNYKSLRKKWESGSSYEKFSLVEFDFKKEAIREIYVELYQTEYDYKRDELLLITNVGYNEEYYIKDKHYVEYDENCWVSYKSKYYILDSSSFP